MLVFRFAPHCVQNSSSGFSSFPHAKHSVRTVLGRIVARLAASYRGGTACAAADGPLPIGDFIGIVMAAGGTVWSAHDLYQVKTQLGPEMKNLLLQSVRDCQAACRMEALK